MQYSVKKNLYHSLHEPPIIGPRSPPNPQKKLRRQISYRFRGSITGMLYPRIAYALHSFELSVMKTTEPLATPTAPAKTPCTRRMHIACPMLLESPKAVTDTALPNNVTTSTNRRPHLSASVACMHRQKCHAISAIWPEIKYIPTQSKEVRN